MQFIYEKADIMKQLQRALGRERRKRAAVETRLRHVEKTAQQLSRHYDDHLVRLAREVSQLRSRGDTSSGPGVPAPQREVAWEMEGLKRQVAALSQYSTDTVSLGSQTSLHAGAGNQSKTTTRQALFMRKRAQTADATVPVPSGPFSRGSTASYRKLKNFFGEEPPRLEDIQSFLEGLGYNSLLSIFTSHQITLAELRHMEASHLEKLGISLGPRVRILSELQKLEPLSTVSDVI